MNPFFQKRTKPLIIAHRGASADAPENTLAAFREAIRQKADAIELDVQLTRDKQLVLMHDFTLNRTTSGRGLVTTKTLQEIKNLDAGIKFNNRFRNEKIPTLDEILMAFKTKINYVVELKINHTNPAFFAKQVYSTVANHNLTGQTLFLSFDPRLLTEIKKINSQAKTCWAFVPIFGWVPSSKLVSRFDALAIASKRAQPGYISRLHQLGKPINVWAGRGEIENFQAELHMGTNFITTNHPALLRNNCANPLAPPRHTT